MKPHQGVFELVLDCSKNVHHEALLLFSNQAKSVQEASLKYIGISLLHHFLGSFRSQFGRVYRFCRHPFLPISKERQYFWLGTTLHCQDISQACLSSQKTNCFIKIALGFAYYVMLRANIQYGNLHRKFLFSTLKIPGWCILKLCSINLAFKAKMIPYWPSKQKWSFVARRRKLKMFAMMTSAIILYHLPMSNPSSNFWFITWMLLQIKP